MTIKIANDFVNGGIKREKYIGYNKAKQYNYKDIFVDITTENRFVKDGFFDSLLNKKLIEDRSYNLYMEDINDYFEGLEYKTDKTDEDIFSEVSRLRRKYYNREVNDYLKEQCQKKLHREIESNSEKKKDLFHDINGINQREIFYEKILSVKNVLIAADDILYMPSMVDVIEELLSKDIKVTLMVKAENIYFEMPSLESLKYVIRKNSKNLDIDKFDIIVDKSEEFGYDYKNLSIEGENALCIGFGEWHLSSIRDFNIDSFVICKSKELMSKALTNSIDDNEKHLIYIPKGYNIFDNIYIVERTKLNYRHIDWIYDLIGSKVYGMAVDELYNSFPHIFMNPCSDKKNYLPIQWNRIENYKEYKEYKIEKSKSIQKYINEKYDSIQYKSCEYSENNRDKIRVDTIKINDISKIKPYVKLWNKAYNPRQYFRNKKVKGNAIVTNFLFFVTPKTIDLYNNLRRKRIYEKTNGSGWHIDYRMQCIDDEKVETFPLYNKAAIGYTKDGKIIFTRKQLGAGDININGFKLSWGKQDINSGKLSDVNIYTPMGYDKKDFNYAKYSKKVGQDRINIVIVNDHINTIRDGEVLLPCIGSVISLSKEYGEKFIKNLNLTHIEDGYYDVEELKYELNLDSKEHLDWSFGGGMFLVWNGKNLFKENTNDFLEELEIEGWTNINSKQTQDSEIHKMERHPRTAIGMTTKGEVFSIVFSGRTKESVGADYADMIEIAYDLYGELEFLMNLDGGASSLLGYVENGELIELNDIAYSNDSCAGSVRKLNSILIFELED